MNDKKSLPSSATSRAQATGAAPESESSKDALLAAVSESSSTDLPVAEAAEPPAQQPPTPAKPKWRRWISLLLEVLLVVALAGVCWLRFTNRGLETWATIANNASWETLFHGSKIEAEQQAAASLQKRGALIIAEPPDRRVTNVTLQHMTVDDDLVAQIAKLYRLATFSAYQCKMTDDQLRCLDNLTRLGSLTLSGAAITDAGLSHLRGLANLEALQLSSTQISDAGLPALANLPNLKMLDLSGTKITDKGLKELASFGSINVLMLSDTQITDAGLRDLATMKSLHHVVLGNRSKVTRPGVLRLKKAIPGLVVEKGD